ncbi:class I SAM-dependent methyltransferase [Verrucomicrobia bacterium]|nr:class I SAM-dependent methyltransferase [Verrucomicrobiota bacterium]
MGSRPCANTLKPEMTDEELSGLREWSQSANLNGRHLEIGTAAGGTLCFMMNCFEANACPEFTVVDTMSYFAGQLDIVKRNLSQNGLDTRPVDFLVMSSDAAFARAEAEGARFDFILVDASHKIRHVMADLRWLRLLNVGGLACFHDYTARFKGVRWPIDRFLQRNSQFSRVALAGSLLCIRRDTTSARSEVTSCDRIWASLWSPILQLDLSLQKRLKSKRNSRPE